MSDKVDQWNYSRMPFLQAPPVPKVYDMEISRQKTECASPESLLPTMQEISTIPLKTGHKTEDNRMDRSSR